MLLGFSSDIFEGWARVCCVHLFLVIWETPLKTHEASTMSITERERGDLWSDDETQALIHAWGDHKVQEKLEDRHRNPDIY